MADIDVTNALTGSTHQTRHGAVTVPYRTDVNINFAEVLAEKGSALAAADVIQAIRIPAGSVALAAGVSVVTPADSTTLTLDVGTGVDADAWVDGFDGKSAAGTYSQFPAAYQPITMVAEDTLDVSLATLTGTLTAGEVVVWVLLLDITPTSKPGLVQLGS
tara:strand:+ start:1798 stop:2280 length:483 start_codon:yes stop_codon:yes gene_type:complete